MRPLNETIICDFSDEVQAMVALWRVHKRAGVKPPGTMVRSLRDGDKWVLTCRYATKEGFVFALALKALISLDDRAWGALAKSLTQGGV